MCGTFSAVGCESAGFHPRYKATLKWATGGKVVSKSLEAPPECPEVRDFLRAVGALDQRLHDTVSPEFESPILGEVIKSLDGVGNLAHLTLGVVVGVSSPRTRRRLQPLLRLVRGVRLHGNGTGRRPPGWLRRQRWV